MKSPFTYGKVVSDNSFVNRKKEIQQLITNFNTLTNTILISPRRWGKSSLVARSAKLACKENKKIIICSIDLYNIRTEEDFYKTLSEKIFRANARKWDDIVKNVKKYFKKLTPKLSYSPDAWESFSIGLDWEEVNKTPTEILDLAEKIAKDKNKQIIICIDEFQNIEFFKDSLSFQKTIRAHWQHHKNVAYCIYGSKRHMLTEVFTSPSMPLYNFGDIHFLKKISSNNWSRFIKRQLEISNKLISKEDATYIADIVDNHSYYVQQLAQQCWLRDGNTVDKNVVDECLDNLLLQMELLFQNLVDSLSLKQVNFLKAICFSETRFSSEDTLKKYDLGTSGTVDRIKKALVRKEIIDIDEKPISFVNPLFKHWLIKYYFKISKK